MSSQSPDNTDPLRTMLNWEPSELYNAQESPEIARQRSEMERLSLSRQAQSSHAASAASQSIAGPSSVTESNVADANQELPPSYDTVRLPTTAMTYTFSPTIPRSSMLLLPPPSHPDSRALYHIAAHVNPFVPNSTVTMVTRGPSADGEVVGGFETGLGRKKTPSVTFKGKKYPFEMILARFGALSVKGFVWQLPTAPLYLHWHCELLPYKCHLGSPKGPLLASFNPADDLAMNDLIRPADDLATLTVLPVGFEHIDQIVLSVLAIEWFQVARYSSSIPGDGDRFLKRLF